MLGMLSGAHLLNESVGILDSILTSSYEKTILDGEIISRIKRISQRLEKTHIPYVGVPKF